jgi:membrane associated rhomboid family serine protease
MPSRVCPYCQGLNGASETKCYRCGKRLPGPVVTEGLGFARGLLGVEAPMTRVIIAFELIVFALCVLADRRMPLGLSGGFRGATMVRFGALRGTLLEEEPWRLLSACFVHGGILHVGMNMFMFASLGAQLERMFGSSRAVLIFVLSGILGYVGTMLWRGDLAYSVGASGGVFGQVGAMIGVLAARRDPLWKKALGQMLIYAVLLTLAFGGIDTAAHLGGLFAGVALGFGFHFELTKLRLHRTMAAAAALMLLGSVASVVLSAQSPKWKDPTVLDDFGE